MHPSDFFKKTIPLLIVFLIGVANYIIFRFTGKGIPCAFNLWTKNILGIELYCPGCGTTRMLVAESMLDFKKAFSENQVVFILQPFLYYELCKLLWHYYTDTKARYHKIENVILVIACVCLVVFGVWRNLNIYFFK